MRNVLLLSIVAVLSGCASASGVANGPNGKPIWAIEAISAEGAYGKAAEKCPGGYTLVAPPVTNAVNNYLITVECK